MRDLMLMRCRSFLIRKDSTLYSRRERYAPAHDQTMQVNPCRSKIVTLICSCFTSAYVYYWPTYLPDKPLQYPPIFDGRVVQYPNEAVVKDYFRWRAVDSECLARREGWC
jgi:tRNA(His) guanylyltransferase